MITMISAFSRLSKKHLVKSVYVLELTSTEEEINYSWGFPGCSFSEGKFVFYL